RLRSAVGPNASSVVVTLGQSGSGASRGRIPMNNPYPATIGVLHVREVFVGVTAILGRFGRAEEPVESSPYLWWTDGSSWTQDALFEAQAVIGWLAEMIGRQYLIAPRRSTDRIQFANTTMSLSSDGSNLTGV